MDEFCVKDDKKCIFMLLCSIKQSNNHITQITVKDLRSLIIVFFIFNISRVERMRMIEVEQRPDTEEDETVRREVLLADRKPVTFLSRVQQVYSVMFKKKPLTDSKKTARLMELLKPTRYKPETVEQLARETKGRIYEK